MVGRRHLSSFVTDCCRNNAVAARKNRPGHQLLLVFLFCLFASAFLLGEEVVPPSVSVSPVALPIGVPTGTTYSVPPSVVPASSPEIVTVNIVGATPSSPVTFSSPSAVVGPSNPPLASDNPSDFVIDGDGCAGLTFTSPNTCQIALHYNAGLVPYNSLETALLTVSSNVGSPTVPLTGAYGAIKLFDETDVTEAPGSASFATPYAIASKQLNLTCSTSPITAKISSTPGFFTNSVVGSTLGYVLSDNYITLATGPSLTPVIDSDSTPGFPPGNICSGTGAVADSNGTDFFADCFTSNYQDYAFDLATPPPLGLNSDTFANPGNAILTEEKPNKNNAGGVPPIDVSSFLTGNTPPPAYPEQALFTLSTSGYEGVYGNSSTFLVTNCTVPVGISSGATTTLNPVNPNNPASQTQTADLDTTPGNNISVTTSSTVANQDTSGIVTNGTVMNVTDYAIPQQLFYQLTNGTSSGPAVCARMSGQLDYTVTPPAPMCAGFLVQCYIPGASGNAGVPSGDNCTSSTAIYVSPSGTPAPYPLFALEFASPDEPAGYNYFTNQFWASDTAYSLGQTVVDQNGYVQQVTTAGTSGSSLPFPADETSASIGTQTPDGTVVWTNEGPGSCLSSGAGTACAPGTGPGLLVGSDAWLCPPTDGSATEPCTPASSNTQTPLSPPTYSASNCSFTMGGLLSGDLCPIDILSAYADGKGAKQTNSLLVPVVNKPKPSATGSITGQNPSGWINNASATANFVATPAGYGTGYPEGGPSIPPANNFVSPPIYSVTAGITTYPNLPDTTYPILSDDTMLNAAVTAQVTAPNCAHGSMAATFMSSATLTAINGGPLSDGIYNLHYFATGCDFSEGLSFEPTPAQVLSATDNWASFPFLTVGVDTTAPAAPSCSAPSTGTWYYSNVSVSCTVTDQNYNSNLVSGPIAGSGFGPAEISQGSEQIVFGSPGTGIQGSQTETVTVQTTVGQGTASTSAYTPAGQQACDLAGNCVAIPQFGPYMISLSPPLTITASSPTITYGQTVPAITPIYGAGQLLGGETGLSTPPTCTASVPATTPVPAGTYPTNCTGGSDSAYNYAIVELPGTLTVSVAQASITLSNLSQVYTGGPLSPTVGTNPSSLSYSLTGAPDTNAGSYPVSASITNPNYTAASTSGSFVITPAPATITLSNLSQVYTGSPLSPTVTTVPSGLSYTLTGGGDTNAGSYPVSASITSPNYSGSTSGTFVISKAPATITLGNLSQVYSGSPLSPTVTTVPSGLSYSLTGAPDTNAGSYPVSASITNANYSGSTSGTFVITQAPATITLSNLSQVYTGSPLSPTVTTVPSGLSYSLTGAPDTAQGSYPVMATITNPNYSGSTSGTFVITAPPAWTITPPTYTFPTISVGQIETYTFTVTNPGPTAVAIKVTIPGNNQENPAPPGDPDDFQFTNNGCNITLGAGKSCNVTVTYIADSDNLTLPPPYNYAYLTVKNASGTVLVQAYMTGRTVDPTVTLTTDNNTFTSTKSTTQMVATLSNPSTQPTDLIILLPYISSGSRYFTLAGGSNSCTIGETLAPGGTCNVYVTFSPPSSGTATETGTVTILSNAANGTLSVSLSGTR